MQRHLRDNRFCKTQPAYSRLNEREQVLTSRLHWSRAFRRLGVFAVLVISGCTLDGKTGDAPPDASVTVDSTRHYQTITGWEAVAQAGQEDVPYYGAIRDTLLDLAANDLGITRLRLWLRSGYEHTTDLWAENRAGRRHEFTCGRFTTHNDNNDPFVIDPAGFQFSQLDFVMENLVLPLKQRVEARGEQLFLNANYVAFMRLCPPGTPYVHNTPEEYAEFVIAAYQHVQAKYGITFDAWEIILEPENTHFWRGRQIGEAMVATARRLERHGIKPRFIAPSTTKAANALKYFEEMRRVPGALEYLDELSYHRYRGYTDGDIAAIGRLGAQHKVNTAMLEHIGSGHENLHQDLKLANVSAWQQFALAYSQKRDDGAQYYLIRNPRSPKAYVELSETGKFFRQYFRYVRPGALRVGAETTDTAADPLAFTGPGDQAVVVLKTDRGMSIRVTGLRPGTYGVRYTTDRKVHMAAPDVRTTGGPVDVSIPDRGVLTLFRKPQ